MYKDLQTSRRDIKVHITGYGRKNKQGHIVLRGYAIDAASVKINGSKTLSRKAKSEAEIPLAEQHLVAAVVKALPQKSVSREPKVALNAENPMVRAFEVLKGSGDIISTNWSPQVRERWMSYFYRNILPRIVNYLQKPFGIAEREQLLNELVEKIEKQGNSTGNWRTVINTAKNNMASADVIYQAMRRVDPTTLPVIELAPARAGKTIQAEQIKSLPKEIRRKLARELEKRVEIEPLLVLGAICMWDGGTRTAEAAAVLPEDFEPIEHSEHVSLWVLWQEKKGKRNPLLKSDAAYRRVPLSYWGTQMVMKCLEIIPLWPEDKTDAPMTADKLSSWIKSLLRDCGCDKDWWAAAVKEELRNPEIDSNGKPIYDVVAYVLRRDRSSRWRNLCGLLQECDYLLGHADKKAKKRTVDYSLDEEQARIAYCCERYVYDRQCSLHPAYSPIRVRHGKDDMVPQFEEISLVNSGDTPVMLTLDVTAAEAAEGVEMILSAGAEVNTDKITVRHGNTQGMRDNKTIIGTGALEEEEDGSLGK